MPFTSQKYTMFDIFDLQVHMLLFKFLVLKQKEGLLMFSLHFLFDTFVDPLGEKGKVLLLELLPQTDSTFLSAHF